MQSEGFATNLHENVTGVCACGAVLKSSNARAVGALVMSGPSEYFSAETIAATRRELRETSALLTHTSLAVRAVARLLE